MILWFKVWHLAIHLFVLVKLGLVSDVQQMSSTPGQCSQTKWESGHCRWHLLSPSVRWELSWEEVKELPLTRKMGFSISFWSCCKQAGNVLLQPCSQTPVSSQAALLWRALLPWLGLLWAFGGSRSPSPSPTLWVMLFAQNMGHNGTWSIVLFPNLFTLLHYHWILLSRSGRTGEGNII